jgi:hypothetical protein
LPVLTAQEFSCAATNLSYIYLQTVVLQCYFFFTKIYNIYNDGNYLKVRLNDAIASMKMDILPTDVILIYNRAITELN